MVGEPLSTLLQKCMQSKALLQGKQIHASHITSPSSFSTPHHLHPHSFNQKLIVFYASCSDLRSAHLLFNTTKHPTIFTTNWMILSSTFCGNHHQPFTYFSSILSSKTSPNPHTFIAILKACIGLMGLRETQQIHSLITHYGFLPTISVANSLLDAYCKCGSLTHGRHIFDEMLSKDVASWTSIISAYSSTGDHTSSSVLFQKMKLQGSIPNEFTWNSVISARARAGDISGTRFLLSEMAAEGVEIDVITWNAVISGFSQGQRPLYALEAFMEMREKRIVPNHVTIAGLVPAFTSMASIHLGREIHSLVLRMNLHGSVFVSSALVDMYSKCGGLSYAEAVFSSSLVKNTALWNAIIGCYGSHGRGEEAVKLFEKMGRGEEAVKLFEKMGREGGGVANETTLTCVLSACSHGGMAEEGVRILRRVKEKGVVGVREEHYGCVVDMLCRGGRMEEAYRLVKEMEVGGGSVVGAFLNGCRIHGRKDLAEDLVGRRVRVGGLVAVSNMYAAEEEWGDVERMRMAMKDGGVEKKAGFSRV